MVYACLPDVDLSPTTLALPPGIMGVFKGL